MAEVCPHFTLKSRKKRMDGLKLYSRSEKGLASLVQTVCVFSEDIGMEFGIEKCAMLVMEKGKIVKSVGISIISSKVITGRWKLQVFRNFRGRRIFRIEDEVQCLERIY